MALTMSEGVAVLAPPVEHNRDPRPLAWLPLLELLERGSRLSPEDASLVEAALGVWMRPGFDTFVSVPRLRFERFEHQLQAAGRVLRACTAGPSWPTRWGSARRSRQGWWRASFEPGVSRTGCWC